MVITVLFWSIIGLGVAIPCSLLVLINIVMSFTMPPERYELNLKKLAIVYFIGLLGWAIFYGVR